jgi:hypothetical protein
MENRTFDRCGIRLRGVDISFIVLKMRRVQPDGAKIGRIIVSRRSTP